MTISQTQGCLLFEPHSDAELQEWKPWPGTPFQFVKVSPRELWIFHDGVFLGSANRVLGSLSWQATSSEQMVCIAPLQSPLDCALRLIEASRQH